MSKTSDDSLLASRTQIFNRRTFKRLLASERINLISLVGRFYAGSASNV